MTLYDEDIEKEIWRTNRRRRESKHLKNIISKSITTHRITLRIYTNKAKTEGSFVKEKKGMKKVDFTISSSEKLASLDFLSLDKKTLTNLLKRTLLKLLTWFDHSSPPRTNTLDQSRHLGPISKQQTQKLPFYAIFAFEKSISGCCNESKSNDRLANEVMQEVE